MVVWCASSCFSKTVIQCAYTKYIKTKKFNKGFKSNSNCTLILFQMLAILIKFSKNSNFALSVPTNLLQFCKHSSSTKKFITLISNLFKILFETISSQFETTTSIWPFKRFWMYSNHFGSFGIFWKF